MLVRLAAVCWSRSVGDRATKEFGCHGKRGDPDGRADRKATREETHLILSPQETVALWGFPVQDDGCEDTAGDDLVKRGDGGEEEPSQHHKTQCEPNAAAN